VALDCHHRRCCDSRRFLLAATLGIAAHARLLSRRARETEASLAEPLQREQWVQLDLVLRRAVLVVKEVEEPDLARGDLVPDVDVLGDEPCLADRCSGTRVLGAGRLGRFSDWGRSVRALNGDVDVAVVFVTSSSESQRI
jgi:hypothetical protein